MKIITAIIALITLCAAPLFAQKAANDIEGLVTLNEGASLNEAVRVLELASVKLVNKKILNESSYGGVIGVPLFSVPWRQAMELIALKNNLTVIEKQGYLAFSDFVQQKDEVPANISAIDVEAKQVRINAIALLADRAYLKSLGIDWSSVFNGMVTLNVDFTGASQVPGNLFGIGLAADFLLGGTQISISTLLNLIESNQKGTVIAKPNIMVSSGKKGFIQVGQDISVKAVDDAGNTTDKFFATGVIMNVEPTIVKVGDTEVVHLKVSVERSSGTPGNISTIINKSQSETELVLYDGEEAVIGGLYDTDTIKVRGGIPFLKDLPWWVLGIRYLTGYDRVEIKERELVIIIKTDIVDNAIERAKKAAAASAKSVVPAEAGAWGYKD